MEAPLCQLAIDFWSIKSRLLKFGLTQPYSESSRRPHHVPDRPAQVEPEEEARATPQPLPQQEVSHVVRSQWPRHSIRSLTGKYVGMEYGF